jgi:hypothetical protein
MDKEIMAHRRILKVLPEATAAAQNPNTSVEEIEFHMRELFHHPRLTIEMVRIYNRLERTWKILTGWVDEDSNVFKTNQIK